LTQGEKRCQIHKVPNFPCSSPPHKCRISQNNRKSRTEVTWYRAGWTKQINWHPYYNEGFANIPNWHVP
jgi:hypothetical protein